MLNNAPFTQTFPPAYYGTQGYNTQTQQNQPKFRQNPFDWKLVSKFDPKLLQATQDVESMNEIASEFLNAIFSDEDMNIIGSPPVYTLLQLLQVVLEYMFKTQKESQSSYKKLMKENERLTEVNERYHKRIHKLFDACKLLRGIERCPTCHRIFPSFKTLDQHVEKKHPDIVDHWKSIRAGEPIGTTKHNDFLENELKKIQKMLTDQNATITKSSEQVRMAMNESTQTPKPKLNPFVKTQDQKTSPVVDENEQIKALEQQTPKSKTAPLKLSDYPEPPPQTVMADTVTLDEVKVLENQPKSSAPDSKSLTTSTRIPEGLRQTAKEFITRPRIVDRQDMVLRNLREQIRADVHEQSTITKIMAKSGDKDEVKEMLKVSMKQIYPMTRKNGTNNIADLRRPPKRYTPEIHDLILEISSDAATYTSTTFIEDLPSESSSKSKSKSKSKKSSSEHSSSNSSDSDKEKSKSKKSEKDQKISEKGKSQSEKGKDNNQSEKSKKEEKKPEENKPKDKPQQESPEYEYEYEYETLSDEPKFTSKKGQAEPSKSDVSKKSDSKPAKSDASKKSDAKPAPQKSDASKNEKKPDANKKPPPKKEESPEYVYEYEHEEEEEIEEPPPKSKGKAPEKPKPKAKSNSESSASLFIEDTTKPKKKNKDKDDSPSFVYEDTTKPKGGKKSQSEAKKESSSKTSDDFLDLLSDGFKNEKKSSSPKPEKKSAPAKSSNLDSDINAILAD